MTHRGEPRTPVGLEAPPDARAGAGWAAALALSVVTRTPITTTFDAGSPGLSPEQLAFARAAAQVCDGRVEGDAGAHAFTFTPGAPRAGSHAIDAGAESSAAGVAAMLALPLSLARVPSSILVRGATHVRGALSFPELVFALAPALEKCGAPLEAALEAAGFGAEGAGSIEARIFPTPRYGGLDLFHRGVLVEVHALACVANVGIGIAKPLERRAAERLRARGINAVVELLPMPIERGRGLALALAAQFERVRTCLVATGESGRSPESVADEAVDALLRLLERRGAVNGRLGAHLVGPCALAASAFGAPGAIGAAPRQPSRFTVDEVTPELLHAAHVARRLLDVDVQVQGLPGADGLVDVRPRAPAS